MKRKSDAPQLSAFAARKLALEQANAAISATTGVTANERDPLAGEDGFSDESHNAPSTVETSQDVSEELEDYGSSDRNTYASLARGTGELTVHPSRSAAIVAAEEPSIPVDTSTEGDSLIVRLEPSECLSIRGRFLLEWISGSIELEGRQLDYSDGNPILVEVPEWATCHLSGANSPSFRISPCQDGFQSDLQQYPLGRTLFPGSSTDLAKTLCGYVGPPPLQPFEQSVSHLLNSLQHDMVFLLGPKDSGKSTMARRMMNSRLNHHTFLYIDLDPGQPEFSPPGMISAYTLGGSRMTIFSGGFCSSPPDLLRAHWIGETSAKEDPAHYIACAIDLLYLAKRDPAELSFDMVLVNTPGWIKGSGLDILLTILHAAQQVKPEGALRVIHPGNSDFPRRCPPGCLITLVPSVVFDTEAPAHSAADRRNLQLSLYFHRSGDAWQSRPLGRIPTWITQFGPNSSEAGITGIFALRAELQAADVLAAINGTIMALAAVDNATLDAIPSQETPHGLRYYADGGMPLDPTRSHCVALVLVKGIDLARRQLHLLCPVTATTLDAYFKPESNHRLVLVSGGLEVPLQMMTAAGYGTAGKMSERPYLTNKPGEGVGWQAWHVRRNIGRRVRTR